VGAILKGGTHSNASFSEVPTLPDGYGLDIVVLQARDPHWLHAYWELQPSTLEKGRSALGEQASVAWLAVRVCELAGPELKVSRFFDIGFPAGASAWTFQVDPSGRSWLVQVGLRTPAGKFHRLVQSNVVQTPPDHPSELIDEQWGWLSLPSVEPGASSSSR